MKKIQSNRFFAYMACLFAVVFSAMRIMSEVTNVVDVAALSFCADGYTNGWIVSGTDSYSQSGEDKYNVRINADAEFVISPDFAGSIHQLNIRLVCSSSSPTRYLYVIPWNGSEFDTDNALQCTPTPTKDTFLWRSMDASSLPPFSKFKLKTMGSGSATGWGFSQLQVITDDPASGEDIAFADRGIAATLDGVPYSVSTVSGAAYRDQSGVLHSATLADVWDEDKAAALRSLAVSGAAVTVYPLEDNQNSAKRIVPAYDQLLSVPAKVQVYPWNDVTEFGYSSKSWEIDSYLFSESPEKIAIFHRGDFAAFGQLGTEASSFNVLASDDPAATALAAARMRSRLETKGVNAPSSALVRAALANDDSASGWKVADHITYSQGSHTTFAITTLTNGALDVSLAWLDTGSWGYLLGKSELSIDLDLSISTVTNGVPVTWTASMRDRTSERISLSSVPAGTYVITVTGYAVAEASDVGGAAALSIHGAFDSTLPFEDVSMVALTVNPGAKVENVIKGFPIVLSAPEYMYDTNGDGTAYARHAFVGFAGTGSIASSGSTNAITVTLTEDSSIAWSWSNAVTDYRVRRFVKIEDSDFTQLTQLADGWYPADSSFNFALPDDYPSGWAETVTKDFSYVNGDGEVAIKNLTVRNPGLEIAWTGEDYGEMRLDERGVAATNGTIKLDAGYDFIFTYYPLGYCLNSELIPEWWFWKYLSKQFNELWTGYEDADDPDGDGLSNYGEYLAGTVPVDAASALTMEFLDFAFPRIDWRGPDSITIEGAESPTGPWTELRKFSTPGAISNSVSVLEFPNFHFFRLQSN